MAALTPVPFPPAGAHAVAQHSQFVSARSYPAAGVLLGGRTKLRQHGVPALRVVNPGRIIHLRKQKHERGHDIEDDVANGNIDGHIRDDVGHDVRGNVRSFVGDVENRDGVNFILVDNLNGGVAFVAKVPVIAEIPVVAAVTEIPRVALVALVNGARFSCFFTRVTGGRSVVVRHRASFPRNGYAPYSNAVDD